MPIESVPYESRLERVLLITGSHRVFHGYDIPPQEVAELYKLYTQTGGPSWINHTNWFTNKQCSTWYGLTVAGGRVTEIKLANNNLDGVTSFNPKPFTALTIIWAYKGTSNQNLSMRFALSDLPATMQNLYLYSTQSIITGALSDLPATMQGLILHSTQSIITGALSDLPATMQDLQLHHTQSIITGALSDLPATMRDLRLHNAQSIITGALSDLPATMRYLHLSTTQSIITGGTVPMAAKSISEINFSSTATNQAGIDDICNRIYADRALFTATAPNLNIAGTNPNPTGVYQAANPPTTPLEKVYSLVNDNLAEGFKKWAITY